MRRATLLLLSFMIACLVPVLVWAQTETVVYYHTDAIGSVRMITDEAGNVVERYDYWPFGVLANAPTVSEVRQFGGKERDTATAFDYFGGRYHQSLTGRFTTVDPVLDIQQAMVDPQRWNRYAYATNRPLTMVDPDGRNPWDLIDFISAAASAAEVWREPGNGWNWVSLGADVLGAALPVIPAPGTLTRAVRAAGELVDTGRGAARWGKAGTLADHFARHGDDFGAKSANEYARRADDFFVRSQKAKLPTKIGPDGTIRVYDPINNVFGAFNPDGTTKTFFRPSSPDYFGNQPGVLLPPLAP